MPRMKYEVQRQRCEDRVTPMDVAEDSACGGDGCQAHEWGRVAADGSRHCRSWLHIKDGLARCVRHNGDGSQEEETDECVPALNHKP